jgi:hypothetical protein
MVFQATWLKGAIALSSAFVLLASLPGEAQILMASGTYRVTAMDQAHQRIGVALPEADRSITQNWVYVQPTTEIKIRKAYGGWYKDEKINYYQFFSSIRPGAVIRVHGGRRWDGGISAKKLGIGAPTP